MKNIWSTWLIVFCVIAATVYYAGQTTFQQKTAPSLLRVGVLPDESEEVLRKRYGSLLAYFAAKTGLEFELLVPASYSDLVQQFHDRKVDLAYFGGLTFIQAHVFDNAVPLVVRDVDTRFTSWFLVRDDNPARSLADLKGNAFAFGSKLSTSGHLMPRYFLNKEKHITPEKFFGDIRYSGAHDKTAYLVRDGTVALGVANPEVVRAMIRDRRLRDNELRVLWETPAYTDYVWAVQDDLNSGVKTRLRDAFLELDANDPAHSKILVGVGAGSFLPAGMSDFHSLQQIAESHGLLEPEVE